MKIGGKKKGSISVWVLSLGLLFILVLTASGAIDIYLVNIKADKARDDIVLSNLAVYADLDMTQLAKTPRIFKLRNSNDAVKLFKQYIQKNMALDTNMNGTENSIAVGQVKIKEYIIYSVMGDNIEISKYNPSNGSFTTSVVNRTITPVKAPNGVEIKETSIYTVLNMNFEVMLKGVLGETCNTDVVALTSIK